MVAVRALTATALCAGAAFTAFALPAGAAVDVQRIADPSLRADTDRACGHTFISDHLAAAANGSAVAIWPGSIGGRCEVLVADRAPGGSWSRAQQLSRWPEGSYEPQIAMNASGEVVVAWWAGSRRSHSRGLGSRVQVATRSARGNWSAPVTIAANTGTVMSISVAIDDRGNVALTWLSQARGKPRATVHVSRARIGSRWSAPKLVFPARPGKRDAVGGPGAPAVGFGPGGSAIVAWAMNGASRNDRRVLVRELRGGRLLGVRRVGPVGATISFSPTALRSGAVVIPVLRGNNQALLTRSRRGKWSAQALPKRARLLAYRSGVGVAVERLAAAPQRYLTRTTTSGPWQPGPYGTEHLAAIAPGGGAIHATTARDGQMVLDTHHAGEWLAPIPLWGFGGEAEATPVKHDLVAVGPSTAIVLARAANAPNDILAYTITR